MKIELAAAANDVGATEAVDPETPSVVGAALEVEPAPSKASPSCFNADARVSRS